MKVFARVVIALAGLAVLLVSGGGAVDAATAGWELLQRPHPSANTVFRQMEGVRRELAGAVRAGSVIYVDRSLEPLWQQRLTEFAYMQDLCVTVDPAEADYRVTVQISSRKVPHVVAVALPESPVALPESPVALQAGRR
jgi:hypothetical protein